MAPDTKSKLQLASVHSKDPLTSTALSDDFTSINDLDVLVDADVMVTLSTDCIVSVDELLTSPAKLIGYFILMNVTGQLGHDITNAESMLTDLLDACKATNNGSDVEAYVYSLNVNTTSFVSTIEPLRVAYWLFIDSRDDGGPFTIDPAAMSSLPMHQFTLSAIVTNVFVLISKVMRDTVDTAVDALIHIMSDG